MSVPLDLFLLTVLSISMRFSLLYWGPGSQYKFMIIFFIIYMRLIYLN